MVCGTVHSPLHCMGGSLIFYSPWAQDFCAALDWQTTLLLMYRSKYHEFSSWWLWKRFRFPHLTNSNCRQIRNNHHVKSSLRLELYGLTNAPFCYRRIWTQRASPLLWARSRPSWEFCPFYRSLSALVQQSSRTPLTLARVSLDYYQSRKEPSSFIILIYI